MAVSSAVFSVVATFLPAPDVVAMLFVLAVALSQAVSSAVFLVVATFLPAPDVVAMLFVTYAVIFFSHGSERVVQ